MEKTFKLTVKQGAIAKVIVQILNLLLVGLWGYHSVKVLFMEYQPEPWFIGAAFIFLALNALGDLLKTSK